MQLTCDFTIAVASADVLGLPNPNVMIEIGYARALHKPVLLRTDAPNTLPFDLRTQRALLYRLESVGGGAFHHELVSSLTGIVQTRHRRNQRRPGVQRRRLVTS